MNKSTCEVVPMRRPVVLPFVLLLTVYWAVVGGTLVLEHPVRQSLFEHNVDVMLLAKASTAEEEMARRYEPVFAELGYKAVTYRSGDGPFSFFALQLAHLIHQPAVIVHLDARLALPLLGHRGFYWGVDSRPKQTFVSSSRLTGPAACLDGVLRVGGDFNCQTLDSGQKVCQGFYYLSPPRPYQNVERLGIVFMGWQWDSFRNGQKIRAVTKALDERLPMRFYGPADKWKTYKNYRGFLPLDGKSVHDALQDAGIVLIFHSEHHRTSGLPTARIFEAIANNALVICDTHPFVEQHFGSSVLYVDTTLGAEEIVQKIERHYEWILKHPWEVAAMTERAAALLKSHFDLKTMLKKIVEVSRDAKK